MHAMCARKKGREKVEKEMDHSKTIASANQYLSVKLIRVLHPKSRKMQ